MSKKKLVEKALQAAMEARAERYVADPAERAANLAKWQAQTPAQITEPTWYHGTFTDVESLRPGRADATFLSQDPNFANRYATPADKGPSADWDAVNKVWVSRESLPSAPNVMPFHVRAENPFDYDNKAHIAALKKRFQPDPNDPNAQYYVGQSSMGDWSAIENPAIQKVIRDLGHDSFYVMEDGSKNLAVYDPTRQLKSATGNTGLFDPNIPRIDENRGGSVEREHHADGGPVEYLSTGEKLIGDEGKINWGDPNEARDFFRADAEMMRRRRAEEEATRKIDREAITVSSLPAPGSADQPSAPVPVAAARESDVSPYAVLPLIRQAESSNDPMAQNKASTAGGLYQFIDETWASALRRMDPERYGRMSTAQLAALKKGAASVPIQERAARFHLEKDIVPTLEGAKIPVNPATIYLSWFQGPQGAVTAYKAPGSAMVKDLFPKTVGPNERLQYRGKPYAEWTRDDLVNWANETMTRRMRGRAEGGPVSNSIDDVLISSLKEETEPSVVDRAMEKVSGFGTTVGAPTSFAAAPDPAVQTAKNVLATQRQISPQGGPVLTSKRIASSFVPPEEQGAISPSMEGVTEGAQAVGRGFGPALQATGKYITSTGPGQFISDVGTVAGHMAQAARENPAEFIGGMLPGIGNIYSLRDIDELKAKIAAARAAGDEETALKLEKFAPLAAVGAAAPFGAGAAVGAVTKAAERAAVKGVARELSPIGLYSYGAEAASMLPQAKGTPEQIAAMLQKQGVKPVEMEGFAEAFAGKPSITAEEASAFFKERMPVVEETLLGKTTKGQPYPEEAIRIEQEIMDRYRDDLNRLHSINADPSQPREARAAAEKEYTKLMIRRDFEIDDAIPNREQLIEAARDKKTPTQFGQYTLPGGENYREVLLKTPTPMNQYNSYVKELRDKYGQGGFDNLPLTEAERAKLDKLMNAAGDEGTGGTFRSGHWDEPNVLAHIRMADRTGPNGEKILHVEEIQSDWAQKGRKEGFKDPEADARRADLFGKLEEIKKERTQSLSAIRDQFDADKAEFNAAYEKLMLPAQKELDASRMRTSDIEKYNAASDEALRQTEYLLLPAEQKFNKASEEVHQRFGKIIDPLEAEFNALPKSGELPSAPYVTSTQGWTDLALKRVLKEAAEGGYDKVVWTPGAEQAARYDLSKQLSRIAYNPDTGFFQALDLNGKPAWNEKVSPEKLESLIGKETAEKLLAKEPNNLGVHSLDSEGMRLGGEGMIGYYDKIVPTQLAKLTKKLDPEAKIESFPIYQSGKKTGASGNDIMDTLPATQNMSNEERGIFWRNLTQDERNNLINQYIENQSRDIVGRGLTITPKMRESILGGLPNYADGGAVNSSSLTEAMLGANPELPRGELTMSAPPESSWVQRALHALPSFGSYGRAIGEELNAPRRAIDVARQINAQSEGIDPDAAKLAALGALGYAISPITAAQNVLIRDPLLKAGAPMDMAQRGVNVSDALGLAGAIKAGAKKAVKKGVTESSALGSGAATQAQLLGGGYLTSPGLPDDRDGKASGGSSEIGTEGFTDMREHFDKGGKKIAKSIKSATDQARRVFPELATRYPEVAPPVEAIDRKTGKPYLAKELSEEAKAVQLARKVAQERIDRGEYTPFFDPAKRFDVDITQYPAYEPTITQRRVKPETQEKYDSMLMAEDVLARLDDAYKRGLLQKQDAENWYMLGQVEAEFIKEFGEKVGRERFKERIADAMAATTGGADPESNWLMAQYGNFMKQQGAEMPKAAYEFPFPIGGRYVSGNMDQYRKMIMEGEGVTPDNPKRYNFSYNFLGSKAPTIDEQMMGIIRPGVNVPEPGTYGHHEAPVTAAAARQSVDPRYYQEVAWAGAKDAKTKGGFKAAPFIDTINESIERTSQVTGLPPEEVVRKGLVRSEMPMYGAAGATVGAGALSESGEGEPRAKGGTVVSKALMLTSKKAKR
jgi:hypothetical protein